MAREPQRSSVPRRKFLTAAGVVGAASLAGCNAGTTDAGGEGGDGADENGTTTDGPSNSTTTANPSTLTVGGSSTVYPITSRAASVWGYNPPADDAEYWGPSQYGIDTDERLADYWASQYGFEPTGRGGAPPFAVSVNLSHSGIGLENLRAGRVDIGDASAPVEAELSDLGESELERFVDHVVGVDAQPIVVSQGIYDAGVTRLSAETVRAIYEGEIETWSEVDGYDGPDRPIQAVGRAVGSGTDTAFRANMLGSPDAEMPGVDVRKGENQQVARLVANSDNAIAYMALAFVDDSVPAVALSFDGTVYEPGRNLADEGYPLARDLHCYTYDGTSKQEAAFLRMIMSEFGQQSFVGPAGYARLSDSRREEELGTLPEPTA